MNFFMFTGAITVVEAAAKCNEALSHFNVDNPVQYALRPSVRSMLEHAALYNDDEQGSAAFSDAEWFRLSEVRFAPTLQPSVCCMVQHIFSRMQLCMRLGCSQQR